jgi:nitroreductase
MTMFATSRIGSGESVLRPRLPVVTDQGGLIAARVGAAQQETRCGAVLTPADVATVIGIAARAPSVHNTQPWRFHTAGDLVELHADPDRLLAHIDPAGRELMISCGAALFGLRLGLRQLGRIPAVQPRPDPLQPWLVARAWPDEPAAVSAAEAELLAAVPHRHTHRGPFTPGDVSSRLLATLATDAAAEGSELTFVRQPSLVHGLAALVDLAAAEQDADPAIGAETRRWLRPAGSAARDGVPERSTAIGGYDAATRFRQREYGAREPGSGRPAVEQQTGEPPAATAVLVTAGDTPDDWLRAGQALHRLLLRAATRWVFASLQSQPLESPRYRADVKDLLGLPGQPQMLLQFGRANTALATPRRQQDEFRTNENHA